MTPALAGRGFAIGQAAHRRQLVAVWLVVAVSAVPTVVLLARASRIVSYHADSKSDIARQTAAKYVFEAMPSWQRAHPGRTCPEDLAELNEWMNCDGTRDPWGRDYRWACRAPAGLSVASAGPDGRFGTSDDVEVEP